MTDNENWGAQEWRAPALAEGDMLIYSEHGRILNHGGNHSIDYRSHYFRIVKAQFGGNYLLVEHGGGHERLELSHNKGLIKALENLSSDDRYMVLWSLHAIASTAARNARTKTAQEYILAHAEGRLKKRKIRNQDRVKIFIEARH